MFHSIFLNGGSPLPPFNKNFWVKTQFPAKEIVKAPLFKQKEKNHRPPSWARKVLLITPKKMETK